MNLDSDRATLKMYQIRKRLALKAYMNTAIENLITSMRG